MPTDDAALRTPPRRQSSNAIKDWSEEPLAVDITSQVQGNTCTFRVRDNGMRIDAAYHERIFGLFRRLHGLDVPGTGVGLALTRKIVEKQAAASRSSRSKGRERHSS